MKRLLSHALALTLCFGLTVTASASTEDVTILKYNGVEYGKVTLSGYLSEAKTTFNIEGESFNWSYANVAQNSTCTIEPSAFDGYLLLTLDSYTPSNGAYVSNVRDDWMATVLWADGKSVLGYGFPPYDEYKEYYASSGHPASFTFGTNTGEMPVYGDTYSYTLHPDGTLYVLRCEVYDKAGDFVIRFNQPYFVKEAQPGTTTPAIVGNFTDVSVSAYYADAVAWAVEKNVTSGTSVTTFSPDATCTTAQILTFLWRANGSPEPTIENPFSDVSDKDYYAKAALWAHEKELISGHTFVGATPCTRSMTVTYLWKLAGSPKAGGNSFSDVSNNADYAQAVAWAVSNNITSGTSDTTFSPGTTCTRGQIATFLYRAFSK